MELRRTTLTIPFLPDGMKRATKLLRFEADIRVHDRLPIGVRHSSSSGQTVSMPWTGERLLRPAMHRTKQDWYGGTDDVDGVLHRLLELRFGGTWPEAGCPVVDDDGSMDDSLIMRAARSFLRGMELVDGAVHVRTAGPLIELSIGYQGGVNTSWSSPFELSAFTFASKYRADHLAQAVEDIEGAGQRANPVGDGKSMPIVLIPESLVEDVDGLHAEAALSKRVHYYRRRRLHDMSRERLAAMAVMRDMLDRRIESTIDLRRERDAEWHRAGLDLDVEVLDGLDEVLDRFGPLHDMAENRRIYDAIDRRRRERMAMIPARTMAIEELNDFGV